MNQEPTTYVGVDVSKATLDVNISNHPHQAYPRTSKGICQLFTKLKQLSHPHLICESTAGYQQLLVEHAFKHDIPISVVPPGRVRHLAHATGLMAKTDRIDAQLLTRYGQMIEPTPLTWPHPDAVALRQWIEARTLLVQTLVDIKNRLELAEGFLLATLKKMQSSLERQLKEVQSKLDKLMQSSSHVRGIAVRLMQLKGVGQVLAATLIAYLPELGQVSDKSVASLVGLAPHPNESGAKKGKRSIRAGRANIRKILYMGAVSATQFNPVLKTFYQRLRDHGKPAKVAIVAVMRKMLTVLNKLVSHPNFSLA